MLVAAVLFLAAPLHAQEADDARIEELVQREVERLLTTGGALDAAIEKGIENFFTKMRARNLRPINAQRDHISGNPQADVMLVEYSDFECPFCKRFHPTVIQLMENNPQRLGWVYRHFPLAFHNPGAQKQAEASECIAELGGNDAFWAFTHAIYRETRAGGNGFPLDGLRPLAEEQGVDGGAFAECLDSGRMRARVEEDHQNGVNAGISGTPSGFLINRNGDVRFIAGAVPLEHLQGLVDELLP